MNCQKCIEIEKEVSLHTLQMWVSEKQCSVDSCVQQNFL